jgi:hypothetical protein
MTIAKAAAALMVAFVGGVALGVAIGPSIRHTPSVPGPFMDGQFAPGVEEPSAPETRPQATASHPRSITKEHAAAKPMIAASEPKIQERLKPVLSRGTRVEMAADGFASAEQFATVAHAAHNTTVPFVVLKHRILEEGRTLAEAIHESKPALDAKAEVTRARQEAQSDLEAIAG